MKTIILAVIVAITTAKVVLAGVDTLSPTVVNAHLQSEMAIEEATQ